MKKTLRMVATATVLTSLAFNLIEISAQTWIARSVEEVKTALSMSETGVYVVQWGDTLNTIAKATGYTVEQLAAINAITNVDLITAGSVLYFDDVNHTATYIDVVNDTNETYELPFEEVATYVVPQMDEWITNDTTEAPIAETFVVEEVPVEEFVAPEVTVEKIEEPVEEIIEAPIVEEVTELPETTVAPVIEETVAPAVETTVASVVEEPVVSNSGLNEYGGIISEAKEWIAMKESGGNYEIWNPSGKYYGRYQLTVSYLNGDLSRENQERVADAYVIERYGSWEAAKVFWEANGWY